MQFNLCRIIYTVNNKKHTLLAQPGIAVKGIELEAVWNDLQDTTGRRLTIKLIPQSEIVLNTVQLESKTNFQSNDKIFMNGYQSWTDSREFRLDERMPGLTSLLKPLYRHHHLPYYSNYSFRKYTGLKGHLHGYTYCYIRRSQARIDFIGSLSENNGFTVFDVNVLKNKFLIEKDCRNHHLKDPCTIFDLFFADGEENLIFPEYFRKMGVPNPVVKPASGWTSWYYHYTKISEHIILDNLNAFRERKVPIDIFQIDDGYQKAVGDWQTTNEKFPNGMRVISDKIHAAGFKAGLWLAPFVCEAKSDLMKLHPDWLLRDKNNMPIFAGFNVDWSGDFYALDVENKEFRDYLRQVFKTVLADWNFDMVKLDFLYAACILPRQNKTRGQIMCESMDFLREITGKKWILGCGVPLGSAFGKVDYCRIGNDVGLTWDDRDPALIHFRERVSTVNSLLNAAGRRQLNGLAFYNDPDVFILRHENNSLSIEQRYTLFLFNLLFGGLVFTSDNIKNYRDNYFGAEMSAYLSQFPLSEKIIKSVHNYERIYHWKHPTTARQLASGNKPYENVYEIDFEIRGKSYLVLSNLGSRTVRIPLPEGFFYENKTDTFYPGRDSISMPPFSSYCLYHIQSRDLAHTGEAVLAGSTGHIFPGSEISELRIKESRADVRLSPLSKGPIMVYFELPEGMEGMTVNEEFYPVYMDKGLPLVKALIR